ncbi:MAG: Smr/MutS family protein [Bacilli bacterium]|jgi:DNA-nicking Smr family endonuclease|nr:Smr/MutS family protein [Bacilli bacterium]
MNTLNNIFIDNLPTLDLHGYDRNTARLLVNDFINDNYKLKKKKVVIIHGRGLFILKQEVESVLKQNNQVKLYQPHMFNIGCTIVELNITD